MQTLSSLKRPAEIANLRELMEFVASTARNQGYGDEKVSQIELVTEEAIVNVCSYAYGDGGGVGDVEVMLKLDGKQRFVIEIIDSGAPFDPTASEPPDLEAGIEERGIGGLGIHFMKQLMDEVLYRREGEKNILSFVVSK